MTRLLQRLCGLAVAICGFAPVTCLGLAVFFWAFGLMMAPSAPGFAILAGLGLAFIGSALVSKNRLMPLARRMIDVGLGRKLLADEPTGIPPRSDVDPSGQF